MIVLEVAGFQWVKGPEDDPNDHCAHGRVSFRINDTVFVTPTDGLWTVSAAALFLLRTLTEDHSIENPVSEGNLLFPCCAFSVWDCGTRFKVMCMGCPTGVNPEVIHQVGKIVVRSEKGSESVELPVWRAAVIGFVDSVLNFYQTSSPKVTIDDEEDLRGWSAFWLEWKERYTLAKAASA